MKKAFDEFISRLDITEERTYELEDISIGSSKTEKQKGHRLNKINRISRTVGQLQKV